MVNSHTKRSTNSHSSSVDSAAEAPDFPAVGRLERRTAETRVKLFRCALALIAERGLDDVTVEDITEAADVGKGTFFNYFPSKHHVLGVMAEIQIGKFLEATACVAKGTEPLYPVLHGLVRRLAEEPGRSPKLARALMSSFLGSGSVREILKRKLVEGRRAIEEVVQIGQERGEINPVLKKETVAMQLLQMVMGTVLLWSLHEKPSLRHWMEDSFQHAWRAIAAPGKKQKT